MRTLVPLGVGIIAGFGLALVSFAKMFDHYGLLVETHALLQSVENRQKAARAAAKGLVVEDISR